MAEHPSEAREIIKRWEAVAALRSVFETTWQDIADEIIGRRDFTTVRGLPGQVRTHRIYDNTAMQAGGLLAAGMHTLLTNTATTWFRLKPEFDAVLEQPGVPEWFEAAQRVMHSHFNAPKARFMSQMGESYHDFVHFANFANFIHERPEGGFLFEARPLSEVYIQQNWQGVLDTFYRHISMTARQAVQQFGPEDVPKAAAHVEAERGDTRVQFLHWIRKRPAVEEDSVGPRGMEWGGTYISLDEFKFVGEEGGFHEQPLLFGRWSTDAHEVYGRGPGIFALPAARMLNVMKKTILKGAQKAVDPVTLVRDGGVLHQLRMSPGGVNVIRDLGVGPDPIRYIPNQGRVDIGIEMLRDERTMVRGSYHFDLLQLLQDPRMTATQVIELSTRMARLLSPILGRAQDEVLEPMIERAFGILARQGLLPPAPPALQGTNVRVDYVSPISRAQREGDAAAIIDGLTIGANLQGVAPEILDVVDVDTAYREVMEAKGVPLAILRSDREISNIRQQRAQQAAQRQEFTDQLAALKTAGQAGPGLEPAIDAAERVAAA